MMPERFEDIYEQYKDMVYNVSLSYLQNAQDAEEVTQDVFVKVYQKLSSFSKRSSLKTWIYRITTNACLDFIKAKNRKKRFAFISSLFNEDNRARRELLHFDHPGVQLEQKEAMKRIFDQINLLPENQKTAIILCRLEKLSHKEAAEIMNVSPKAVESLLQRARKKLLLNINKKNR